jgi:molybdenum cofactor cytidylyltransferase
MSLAGVALVLLASGRSVRFGPEDKLLADCAGRPLGAYAADLFTQYTDVRRIAIIPADYPARAALFGAAGWQLCINPEPECGQGGSIARGVAAAEAAGARAVIITLADMPLIRDVHLEALAAALGTRSAVISMVGTTMTPPAIFAASSFTALTRLDGDRGAGQLFRSLPDTAICALEASAAHDIDTKAALAKMIEELHAHAAR